jgi:hypothetical protein
MACCVQSAMQPSSRQSVTVRSSRQASPDSVATRRCADGAERAQSGNARTRTHTGNPEKRRARSETKRVSAALAGAFSKRRRAPARPHLQQQQLEVVRVGVRHERCAVRYRLRAAAGRRGGRVARSDRRSGQRGQRRRAHVCGQRAARLRRVGGAWLQLRLVRGRRAGGAGGRGGDAARRAGLRRRLAAAGAGAAARVRQEAAREEGGRGSGGRHGHAAARAARKPKRLCGARTVQPPSSGAAPGARGAQPSRRRHAPPAHAYSHSTPAAAAAAAAVATAAFCGGDAPGPACSAAAPPAPPGSSAAAASAHSAARTPSRRRERAIAGLGCCWCAGAPLARFFVEGAPPFAACARCAWLFFARRQRGEGWLPDARLTCVQAWRLMPRPGGSACTHT